MGRRGAGFVAGAAAALLLVSVTGPAGADAASRREVREYTGPGVVHLDPIGAGVGGTAQWGGIKLETDRSETHVALEVADAAHPQMGGYLSQNRPKGEHDVDVGFCGATDAPVEITGGRPVWIYVSTSPCGQRGGIPTSGEVVATFTP